MVGAVGIENNNASIFKDLRGTTRNAKLLKRNDEACKGILIAPSKLPQNSLVFFADVEIPKEWDLHPLPLIGSRLRAQILRRGWQADIWYLCGTVRKSDIRTLFGT
jgi:hypothetical protein